MPLFTVNWKETAVISRSATFEAPDADTAENLIMGGDRPNVEVNDKVDVSDYHSFCVTQVED